MTEQIAFDYDRAYSRLVSDEAWAEICASGRLTERGRQALVALRRVEPATAQEIAEQAGIPGLWKRCSELAKLGVIAQTGLKRVCRVTGKTAQTWIITGRRP